MRTLALVALLGCSNGATTETAASGSAPTPAPRKGSPFDSFATLNPKVGDVMPAIELADLDGKRVKIADALAHGPVVIVSGSFSCPLFRMKTPRFEELATRWAGKAEVYFVFSEEAHPRAGGNDRLNGFAAQVAKRDKDGDNAVTVAEYGDLGPRYMFDAFDINRDGIVRSHELVAAKRIAQFSEVDEPKTIEQRIALAKRFRTEVPGTVPVLIDDVDNRVGKQLGELPNSAHVIGKDGKVTMKIAWAAVGEVEKELARILGGQAPAAPPADLALIQGKLGGAKPVLVEFTAPGCEACVKLQPTLAEADVAKALERFEVVKLSVELDPAWRMFEQLDLAATPAFVVVTSDGKLGNRIQGAQTREQLLAFLK